jgi:hypothetical protein
LKLHPNGTKDYRSWAEFKLMAADWYLQALEESFRQTGDLDRFVGVEMAFDGFLAACSSAFDAAVSGLIQASERYLQVPQAKQLPPYERSWAKAAALVEQTGQAFGSRPSVDAAMVGPAANPTGWLSQCRQLRNRTQHENTLSRAFFGTVGSDRAHQQSEIHVPGLGQVEPLRYVRTVLPRLRPLVEAIVRDAEAIDP